MSVLGYYTGLTEFRELFGSGMPILTYHKLGRRPRRVRLKGLYVSASLFHRQLQELRSEGWTSGSLDSALAPGSQKRVVVTFDDGYSNVLANGLAALESTGFKAIQFLVPDFLGRRNEWDVLEGEHPERLMDAMQVREWIAAGHDIGAHSCTHADLTRIPPSQAQEEIRASKKKLEDLFGRAVAHFCYPYGQWNPAVRDLVSKAGFTTACTTDTGMNQPGDSPYTLKRFTARYRSRNLKTIWQRLRRPFT